MLAPTQKPAPTLIHHPSDVLDDLCAFTLANSAWAQFDEQLSELLTAFEERNRALWTPQAVRQSLGR